MIYKNIPEYEDVYCNYIFEEFALKKNMTWYIHRPLAEIAINLILFPGIILTIFFLAKPTFRKYIAFALHELNMRRGKYAKSYHFNWKNIKDIIFLTRGIFHAYWLKLSGVKVVVTYDPNYYNRIFVDTCVNLGICVFVTQNFIVYRYNDTGLYTPDKATLTLIESGMNSEIVETYFDEKMNARGNYTDSNRALKIKDKFVDFANDEKVTYFLHVFGDSALGKYLDESRKTDNYFEWLQNELSSEKMDSVIELRIHPSSRVWGENYIDAISTLRFLSDLDLSLYISNGIASSVAAMKSSKIVKTFSGNVAQEAVALGTPSSTQLKTPMERNFNFSFPCSSVRNNNYVTPQQSEIAKKQIYIQECILSFRELTGMDYLYRGQLDKADQIIKIGTEVCKKNKENFRKIGAALAEGYSHSLNPECEYIEYVKNIRL